MSVPRGRQGPAGSVVTGPVTVTPAGSSSTEATSPGRRRPSVAANRVITWGPVVTDALTVFGLTFLFQRLRFGSDGGAIDIGVDVVDYRSFSVIVSVAWVLAIVAATGRARMSDLGILRFRGIFVATFGVFLGTAVFALLLQSEVSRAFVLTVFPSGILLLGAGRLCWSLWVRRQRATGAVVMRVLIVGSAPSARRLETEFRRRPDAGVVVVAVAVHPGDPRADDPRDGDAAGRFVVRTGEEAARLATDTGAGLVVVTDAPAGDQSFLQDLSWGLESSGAGLAVSSHFGLVSASRFSIVPIGGHPLVSIESTHLSTSKHVLKRTFDVVLAVLALAVAWPVLAVIAAIVRLDSPGPAIFTQERVGRDGRAFLLHKFRSMHVGSERLADGLARLNESDGVLFKMREDPRITRVGRVLRRTSLDELPQLVNILRGHMSFVGPRPAMPSEVARYAGAAHRRLLLRPGLTGVWQVSGRSDLPWEDGLRLDLTYVENWSMLGDLVVLVRTIGAVLGRRGAY